LLASVCGNPMTPFRLERCCSLLVVGYSHRWISVKRPPLLSTTTTLMVPERLCFLRVNIRQRYEKALRHPSHPRKMPYNYARGRFSGRGRKSDKVRKACGRLFRNVLSFNNLRKVAPQASRKKDRPAEGRIIKY
jgi:hypothetical protein